MQSPWNVVVLPSNQRILRHKNRNKQPSSIFRPYSCTDLGWGMNIVTTFIDYKGLHDDQEDSSVLLFASRILTAFLGPCMTLISCILDHLIFMSSCTHRWPLKSKNNNKWSLKYIDLNQFNIWFSFDFQPVCFENRA